MTFRLHLDSRRAKPPAFHLDAAAWARAAARHPDLAALVDVSFSWDGEQLPAHLSSANALIASSFDRAAVNAAPRLGWVHTTGAGVDHLMPISAFRPDLVLTNSSGIHGDKAAESAVMALLMLNARMPEVMANQHARVWDSLMTAPIRGKRLVLIGFGDIGQAVGRAALSLGLAVTAVTRSGTPKAEAPGIPVAPTARLDELLPAADFVVVTAPLTEETRNMMSAARLALLPPHAGVVNMARAALADYPALAQRLREGLLGGAVLDVFDNEPLAPGSAYWDVPRLVVTPHITCDAPDYGQRVLDLWFDNFHRLRAGEALRNQVDRAQGY
ncbi:MULTISPECIES: D-2-hydroxyacid dehydrogenase [Cupriavidus]